MKTGLTLGKFAPFHKGHQLLIERALAETDHVVVIVYHAPETTSVPLPVRANWIRTLYPDVEVLEAWDGPTVIGDTSDIKHIQEQFLIEFLQERTITHFFSSEFYGAHVSKALGALDRRVDEARSHIPISGTTIRTDPFTHREFIDPHVYRDLVSKVVFVGAPSTGKTSLAQALAQELQTTWMPEYGREYWEKHQKDRRLTREQLLEIAEGHIEMEDTKVLEANRYLFVDTDATTTCMFSRYYHGKAHPDLERLADETRTRYDLFFLCGDDIPYANTWDRSGDTNRKVFQQQIRVDLLMRRIPFITLQGSLAERIRTVSQVLHGFDKFASRGDHLTHKEAAHSTLTRVTRPAVASLLGRSRATDDRA